MQNAAQLILGILVCAGVSSSIHAQAYRVTVISDGEVGPGQTLAITDAGDAVVRVGDDLGIWQASPGFGRPAGLTMVGEIDSGAVNRVSRHIDAAARVYGSVNGQASAWSREMGHADLNTRNDIGSWVDDASWPALLVGGEQGKDTPASPVLWTDGVRVELPLPAGARSAVATGVNDGGEIVGVTSADASAVIRWPAAASALDRNTAGVIWIGSEPVALNELIVGSGLSIVRTDDVDNRGRIAATAVDTDGLFYAVVLEPAGADLNGDGAVSPADLNAWIALAATDDRRGDLTGDGVVDAADFAVAVELITTRLDSAEASISGDARALALSRIMDTNGVYDAVDPDAEPGGGLVPGNSDKQAWINGGRKYHPTYNPNCYGCNGDDPGNIHHPDGGPGWPGTHPDNPEKPRGGPGGRGADGDPAGDGGSGGDGAPGTEPDDPGGAGGDGGRGGDNTDDGSGGRGGKGGNGGRGGQGASSGVDNGGHGGEGGTGGRGGFGGSNGGNGGEGGEGGRGGDGGQDDGSNGNGGSAGGGGTGGAGGDARGGDGDGGGGGTGGNGGDGGNADGGTHGNGGSGGSGGTGGNGDGDGSDGSDGASGADGDDGES